MTSQDEMCPSPLSELGEMQMDEPVYLISGNPMFGGSESGENWADINLLWSDGTSTRLSSLPLKEAEKFGAIIKKAAVEATIEQACEATKKWPKDKTKWPKGKGKFDAFLKVAPYLLLFNCTNLALKQMRKKVKDRQKRGGGTLDC